MEIECTFYGPFRDAVGEKTLVHECREDATIVDLFASLESGYPALAGTLLDETGAIRESVTVLRNRRPLGPTPRDEELTDGDSVALTTPISGGRTAIDR